MGCFNSKDPDPQNINDIQIRSSFNEYSDFPKYYKHIRRCLKFQQFKFGNPQDPITFKQRLANINGISTEVAKIWISSYIDYMIVATWGYSLGTKSIIYPPYAIQQVARLHTCYRYNYKEFIMIITEKRKQSFYFPDKLVAQQDPLEYYALKYSYNWAKNFLSDLFERHKVRKAYKKKIGLDQVWENFDITLMQSEFSFNFTSAIVKAEFQKTLLERSDTVTLKSQEPEEIFRVIKSIRNILSLGELISNPRELHIPTLMIEDFGSVSLDKVQEDLVKSINNIVFGMNFVNLLAWESRISIEEALLWIREYKRFLFLSFNLFGKAQLYPSEPVNQVWRLHLQFSPFYQDSISQIKVTKDEPKQKKIINKEENEDCYEKTLIAYEYYFGAPNNKIWPWSEESSICGGHYTSYYIYLARNCMTEYQKARAFEKRKNFFLAKLIFIDMDNASPRRSEISKRTSESEEQKEDPNKFDFNEDLGYTPAAFDRFLITYMSHSIEVDPELKTKANSVISLDELSNFQASISNNGQLKQMDEDNNLDFEYFWTDSNSTKLCCSRDCWKGNFLSFEHDV